MPALQVCWEGICSPPDKQVPSCIYFRRLLVLSRLLAFVNASWQHDRAGSPAVLSAGH